jgi:hypothetical protein
MQSEKEQAIEVLNQLPDDCTLEEIQYHLYVAETIKRRLEHAEQGGTWTSQDEVENCKARLTVARAASP